MCKCTPGIKTPWCGRPGCERPPQVSRPSPQNLFPHQKQPAEGFADARDIPDPLARHLYNEILDRHGRDYQQGDGEVVVTALASLLSGFLLDIKRPRREALIDGIYRALKQEHGIP